MKREYVGDARHHEDDDRQSEVLHAVDEEVEAVPGVDGVQARDVEDADVEP